MNFNLDLMSISHLLILLICFVLLTPAYVIVIKTLSTIPVIFIVLGVRLFRKLGPREYLIISRAEIFFSLVVFLCFFFSILTYDQIVPYLLFWNFPIIFAFYFFGSQLASVSFQSYNPIMRTQAQGSFVLSFFVILVLIFAPIFPNSFDASLAWRAALTGIIFIIGINAFSALKIPKRIHNFEILDHRHDEVGRQLRRLRRIRSVLTDGSDGRTIDEALNTITSSYDAAFNGFRANNISEAENQILRAEAEVDGLSRTYNDRVRLSLRDELKAKVTQAVSDLAKLRQEFEAANLQGAELDGLEARTRKLATEITDMALDSDTLDTQLEPFEKLFSDLVTTRTALRFRENVGASLDLEGRRAKLTHLIDQFSVVRIASAEDLAAKYRILRDAASEHRAAVIALRSEILRGFIVFEASAFNTKVILPSAITTTAVMSGAIVVYQRRTATSDDIQCELDGVLIDLQVSRSFAIPLASGRPFAISSFDMVGKRGGTGRITVKITDPTENRSELFSFKIIVTSTFLESPKDILALATPSGGVAGFLVWLLWKDLALAGQLGVAIGGMIGLSGFAIQRFLVRRAVRQYGAGTP